MSKRTYAWRDGKLVELTAPEVAAIPNVQPDLREFQSPDGARIGSRSEWREHLKRTGTIEMSHSDLAQQQEKWDRRKEQFAEKVNRDTEHVRPVDPPDGEIREAERSRVGKEVANRLDGRPSPDRVTLIKMAIEESRRHRCPPR